MPHGGRSYFDGQRREVGDIFGQNASTHQLVSVLGGTASTCLLFGVGIHSLWLSIPMWAVLVLSIIWFVLPGHGLIYGPHLWLLAIADIVRALFGIKRRKYPGERR